MATAEKLAGMYLIYKSRCHNTWAPFKEGFVSKTLSDNKHFSQLN